MSERFSQPQPVNSNLTAGKHTEAALPDRKASDAATDNAKSERPNSDTRRDDWLRDAQRDYESLVNSIDGIVWEADAETFSFTLVSKQAERILGYPVEQWINEANFWVNHLYPDDRGWAVEYCLQATKKGADHRLEYRMIASDGQLVWLSDIVTVAVTSCGRVRLRGVMVDITERKRAEEAQRETQTRFRTMFENSGSGMALVDLDAHPVECNPALVKILGYTAEELRGMAFTEFTHPDDRDADWQLYEELKTGAREKYEIEKRFITKDGRTIWGNLVATLVKDEQGAPMYGLGMVQDITERKCAEKELLKVSERLQLATTAANIGIWDWDVVNDVLVWDEATYKLFGLRKEDFGGAYQAWANSLAVEDFERAQAEVQAALRGEGEFDSEYRVVWPDGSRHFIKAASQTFRDATGRPVRMIGVAYDITERKLAEERMNLLQVIMTDVAATSDLASALNVVLRRVCEKTGWAFGQAWIPRRDGTGLECCPTWFAADENVQEFRAHSECMIMPRNVGLPGRVLASRESLWVRDVTTVPNFPRREVAARCGLKAALGVPIVSGPDVIAVLEFYVRRPRERDEQLVKLIATVAAQIGLVCARKLAEQELRWSEERFAKAFQASPEPITIFRHRERTIVEVNERWQSVFGYTREEAIGRTSLALHHISADDREQIHALLEKQHSIRECDVDLLTKQGEVRNVSLSAEQIVINGELCNIYLCRDITERRRAERELLHTSEMLRERNERLHALFKHQVAGIVITSPQKGWLEVNDTWCRLIGYPREELATLDWATLTHPDDLPADIAKFNRLLSGEIDRYSLEKRFIRKDGGILHTETSISCVRDSNGAPQYILGLATDISARKKAEEQIIASREQLRALSDRLRTAKEEEGLRIARELHDELGGALTGLKWGLTACSNICSSVAAALVQDKVGARIEKMVGVVDAMINTVRRISSELRPAILDDLGLISAIEWYARQFEANSGILCRFESHMDSSELGRDRATAMFRIFQETMTNVLRHAQATTINILVEEEEGKFILEVSDNGRGITEHEKQGTHSLGILGMRERAHSVGAEIGIIGIAGKGTTVIVRLPLSTATLRRIA